MVKYKKNSKFILKNTENETYIMIYDDNMKGKKIDESSISHNNLINITNESVENYEIINKQMKVNKVMSISYIDELLYLYKKNKNK